jgi:hypothetical protein
MVAKGFSWASTHYKLYDSDGDEFVEVSDDKGKVIYDGPLDSWNCEEPEEDEDGDES